MQNVMDAIHNVLSSFNALLEVLRFEKQTMLVVRLSAIGECAFGLVRLMQDVLGYSLHPRIGHDRPSTTGEGLSIR